MDDELARPTAEKAPAENEDGADSGDEDGGLDWTKLSKITCVLTLCLLIRSQNE
jgi:hypothetical protein